MAPHLRFASALTLLALSAPALASGAGAPPRGPCGAPVFAPGVRSFTGLQAVGLTADQQLICFGENAPALARTIGRISGLSGGDTRLVGIDVRPASGALYGLGDAGGIYQVDLVDASLGNRQQLGVPLEGTAFGIDFNPTVDRLRIVSDSGQNLRVNVDTGMTTEDGDLNYPAPAVPPAGGIVAAAYTNNDASADTATTLFDLDTALDQIAIQAPPNAGGLGVTGKLLTDAAGDAGFDIYSVVRGGRTTDNRPLAVLVVGDRARLYAVNPLTGRASLRGTFGVRHPVIDLAIPLNQF